jgi:5-methylcytosine-specific restriction endonuclease McrA
MKTWIFQGNTKTFDIDGYLASSTSYIRWRVAQYANEIHAGDTVYLWRADSGVTDSGGVLAECRVVSEVQDLPDDEDSKPFWKTLATESIQSRVVLKLIRLANKKEFIKRSWLKTDGILCNLQILRQPAGTNFPVTSDQAVRLSTVWQRTGIDWSRSEVVAALTLYADLWNQPISKNIGSPVENLSQKIGRVPSAVYNKLMNFRSIDPRVEAAGLSGGSKVDRSVWAEFFDSTSKDFDINRLKSENDRLWLKSSSAEDLPIVTLETEVERLDAVPIDNLLRAYEKRLVTKKPFRRTTTQLTYERDALVVSIARKRSNQTCEIPNCESSPIRLSSGDNYIEVHHIIPLALGGDDTIENVACLCPNHHREIHLGKNADVLTATLKKIRLYTTILKATL